MNYISMRTWAYLFIINIVLTAPCCTAEVAASQDAHLLAELIEVVVNNESKLSRVKMDYHLQNEIAASESRGQKKRLGGPRTVPSGRGYYKAIGTWAQDGIKQYSNKDSFYADGKAGNGYVRVINGEVAKWGSKPDFSQGGIMYIKDHEWTSALPVRLGLRPFEAEHTLSEVIRSKGTSVVREDKIEDRRVLVVDLKRPNEPAYYGRCWIDIERGLPYRIEYYSQPPANYDARLSSKITDIQHQRISSGGWVPVNGKRILYDRNGEEVVTQHIVVDPKSITTRLEDIPAGLFDIEFPPESQVYNAILDIKSKGGRLLDHKVEYVLDKELENLNKKSYSSMELAVSQDIDNEFTARTKLDDIVETASGNRPELPSSRSTTFPQFFVLFAIVSLIASLTVIFLAYTSRRKKKS